MSSEQLTVSGLWACTSLGLSNNVYPGAVHNEGWHLMRTKITSLVFILACLAIGCGGGNNSKEVPPVVSITISPLIGILEAGSTPVTLTVTTKNTDVNWPEPAAVAGTFTRNGNTVIWTLPTIPDTYEFTVTATADSSKKATAKITVTEPPPPPTVVVDAIAAGKFHSLALKTDGSVWAAGNDYSGQLGNGNSTDQDAFVEVIVSGAIDIAAGDNHSLVLKTDGSVWAAGYNDSGQLGNGNSTDQDAFVEVIASGAIGIAAGGGHSLVLKADGSVWAAGDNDYGQLGNGISTNQNSFVEVIPSGAGTIAAGGDHSLVLKADGSVWAAGWNEFGQLGDGTTTDRDEFVEVSFFID